MIDTHAILQNQCPVYFSVFLFSGELIMRVVDQGPNGVMVEYLHVHCGQKR